MSQVAARWEKALIVLVTAAFAVSGTTLPSRIELGDAVLLAAALLLFQGLVRDVARVTAARRRRALAGASGEEPKPQITCMCAESTIGVTAIVAGLLLVFAKTAVVLTVPALAWPAAIGAVMSFGFATRHLVIDWSTRGFRWEPNHDGVVVLKRRS